VGEAVYAIDEFPDDDLLWRIEWIGGVGYNTSVPSDPLMDVAWHSRPPAPKPFDSRDFVLVSCSAFQAKGFNQIGRRKVIPIWDLRHIFPADA
jgi:hypothetical protein